MPTIAPAKRPLFMHVGTRDRILFAKHLTVMLESGIPLRDALKTMRDLPISDSLRYVLQTAIQDLSGGLQLGLSLQKFPSLFDAFFVNVISVGESSGTLSSSLQYLAAQLEKADEIRSRVQAALLYPAVVLAGAVGIAIYLAFFLLPQILPLFKSLTVELPWTTRALLSITGGLRQHWLIIIILSLIAIVGGGLLLRVPRVRFAFDRVLLSLPVMGTLSRDFQTTQFARILGTLLTSGIKIVQALNITAGSLTNLTYRREINRVANLVDHGETMGGELGKKRHLFSATSASMIAIGESTGRLPTALLMLAEFTEKEVDATTRNLTTLIEPLILVLVGGLVGFIALSIITPIYQLTQGMGR